MFNALVGRDRGGDAAGGRYRGVAAEAGVDRLTLTGLTMLLLLLLLLRHPYDQDTSRCEFPRGSEMQPEKADGADKQSVAEDTVLSVVAQRGTDGVNKIRMPACERLWTQRSP